MEDETLTSSPKKESFISVVIPSYKSDQVIFQCLESITHQSLDLPYEIVVVDSSPTNITHRIKESFPEVKVIHLEKRTLSGRARSIGAAEARGDIVFFVDTDCICDKDWMRKLLEVHESGYTVAGGSVVNGTPESLIGTAEYLLEFNEINPWARPGEVRSLPSCNLSVNSSIFDKVGFFPDFLKGEDTIFCENVISYGDKIYFYPEAKILHKNRTGFVHFLKNQVALGEGSIETRRRTKRHGHFLVKYPVLVVFIPVYRTLVIGKRLLQSHIKLFCSYLLLYPLIFLGMLAYTWGFIRGPYRSGLSTEQPV